MKQRRSQYDVTNTIDVTDTDSVAAAISDIYSARHGRGFSKVLRSAFSDFASLYAGTYDGYLPCDTAYHNEQHALDVTLAMARLLCGHDLAHSGRERFGPEMWRLGIVTALFHDAGYIRRRNDRRHHNGAEYTRIHVTRSGQFLHHYLSQHGLAAEGERARVLVHFTGYEKLIADIRTENAKERRLGQLLGSADLLAQAADRCYLEKCRDYLYDEFKLGGLTRRTNSQGYDEVIFSSATDLLIKTPQFFDHMHDRLNHDLGGVYQYLNNYFGSSNLYMSNVRRNRRHLEKLIENGEIGKLKRRPPQSLEPGGK